jgi:hypothetical protein
VILGVKPFGPGLFNRSFFLTDGTPRAFYIILRLLCFETDKQLRRGRLLSGFQF